MKRKTNTFRFLAIICILALLVCNARLQAFAETYEETEYEILTLFDFGISDGKIENDTQFYETGNGILQNVSVEGIYHFSASGNAVYFGGNWQGFMMEPKSGGLSFMYVDLSQESVQDKYRTLGDISVDEAGLDLVETDIKVTVSFAFADITETTADVKITVQVADGYEECFELADAKKETFLKSILLYSAEGCPLEVQSTVHYRTLGFEDFGFAKVTTVKNGDADSIAKQTAADTLDNVSIDGRYLFSTGGNSIYYGGNWQGFVIQPSGENLKFAYMDLNKPADAQWQELGTVTPQETASTLVGEYVRLQVSFAFSNVNSVTTPATAHVTVVVRINDAYEKVFQFSDARTDTFLSRIMFYSGNADCPMSYQSVVTAESLTLTDFGITDGTISASEKLYEQTEATLDKVRVDGYYHFSESGNKVYFGGNQSGFGLIPTEKDTIQIVYKYANETLLGEITSEEAGCSLTGNDVKVRAEFLYNNIDDTYANVKLTLIVEDTYKESFVVESVAKSALKRMLCIWAEGSDTPCTIKTLDWQEDPFDNLLEVTPSDFGVADGTYTYAQGNGNLATTGILENKYTGSQVMTLDGKVFSANVCFNDKESQIRIGGGGALPEGSSAWYGVLFKRLNDTQFEFVQCADMGLHSRVFDVNTAGLNSVTDSFNLKISFEYVDRDRDGEKDDVKYGIWFDNELYNRSYIYALDNTSYLGTMLGIYPVVDGAEVVLSSEERIKEDTETPYILEDAGVNSQEYTKVYQGAINGMDMERSSISGKVALHGESSIILYGTDTNAWFGYRLSLVDGMISLSHSNNDFGVIAKTEVKEDEPFHFTLAQKFVDADADGEEDDIRLSLWVNHELHDNRYFYLLDYAENVGTGLILYPNNQNVESSVVVEDSVSMELYNLAGCEYGYLIAGRGNITVNGQKTDSGTVLTTPGDYLIRCAGFGSYVKRIALYSSGDAHPDGAINVKDLVAVKKVIKGFELATESGKEGADVDRDDVVNNVDMEAIRLHLTGGKTITPTTDYYLTYEEDVMPIAGYSGPYRETVTTDIRGTVTYDYLNDKTYRLIQEAGINLIYRMSNNYTTEPEEVKEALALADKYDLDIYVNDNNLNEQRNDLQLANFMDDYYSFSSFKGTFLVDEPVTSSYGYQYYNSGTLAKLEGCASKGNMLNNYSNHIGAVNLNPINKELVEEANQANYADYYRAYIDEYVRTYDAKNLAFDYYVFDEITGSQKYATTEGYFENLSIMREKSNEYRIPFWSFVQTGSYWNGNGGEMSQKNNTTPTEEQMLWNINTSLAYGAKGIVYFPLIQPYYFAYLEGGGYEYRNGLIGANGEITQWYDYAKNANKQIALVDEVLLNATSETVLAVGTQAQTDTEITMTTYDILDSIGIAVDNEQGAVVGVFKYQGKTAYYVVNYDMENSQTITLHFKGVKEYSVSSVQMAEGGSGSGTSCALTLNAGGAALVVVENE